MDETHLTGDGQSFGGRLSATARDHGADEAITFLREDGGVDHITWSQVDDRSTQIARQLRSLGVTVGDRLAIEVRNSPEHQYAVFGGWKVGAMVVPIRWDLPGWERQRVLEALDPRLVIRGADDSIFAASSEQPTDALDDVIPPRASAICSSGSTGVPKVIIRRSPGLYDPARDTMGELFGPSKPGRRHAMIVAAPAYHNNGYLAALELVAGRRVVLLERFGPERMFDAIEEHGGTGFVAATIMLQRLARHPRMQSTDFSGVEWVMQGAAPIADWLVEFWIGAVGGDHFLVTYGSSELIGTTVCRGSEWLVHRGTSGRPGAGTDVRILDESGTEVPIGEVGLIYLRSASGPTYDYMGAAASSPRTTDGFETLGDLGWVDEDGYLYISDRRIDLIVSGGANVYPAEVEAALSDHPEIADVVVVGLPDPEWGKRVHAIVQATGDLGARQNAQEVIEWGRQRLSPYKVPKSVEFVTSLGRSDAGKVNRSRLVDDRAGSR